LELRKAWLAPFAVERLDDNTFVSRTDGRKHRRWGPEVMAQSLIIAGRHAQSSNPLSLRALFVRPATWLHDLTFTVEALSTGRRLQTRLVRALQDGKVVFTCTASFGDTPGPLAHMAPAPTAPAPDTLRDWWEELHEALPSGNRSKRTFWDLRSHGSVAATRPAGEPPRRTTWARPRAPLPDDPLIHAAAVLAVSDTALIHTVGLAYQAEYPASLDHSIWWHESPKFDDWLLYASSSPVGRGGLAMIEAAFYAKDGRRIATVAQECIIP